MTFSLGDRVKVKDGYIDSQGHGVKAGDIGAIVGIRLPIIDVEFASEKEDHEAGHGDLVPVPDEWLEVIALHGDW